MLIRHFLNSNFLSYLRMDVILGIKIFSLYSTSVYSSRPNTIHKMNVFDSLKPMHPEYFQNFFSSVSGIYRETEISPEKWVFC